MEALSAAMAPPRVRICSGCWVNTTGARYFERQGGYNFQSRVDAVLDGLDLRDLSQDTPVDILSGGQKTRLGLAGCFCPIPTAPPRRADNHLDIEALEWLERFLQDSVAPS